MAENYDLQRQKLKAVWNRPNWDEKVDKMSPAQLMAVYKKYLDEGKIK